MITAAQLRVVVGADVAGALSGLGAVNRAIGGVAGFFSRAASSALGFIAGALGLNAIGSVTGFVSNSIIGMNSTLEGAQVAFTQLLGSSGAATAFLDQVKQFAKETPFDLPGVLEGSQRLLAYGFSAQQIIPELTRIGDIASGLNLGQEGFSRLLVAVGQMHTAGRVLQQDLNQLQQAGVNTGDIFAIMAQQTGLSVPALKQAQAAGKLSSATFEKAFAVFAQTKFGGLMQKQSNTFAGAMSNIRDALGQAGATAFLPLFTALRDLALRFVAFTNTAQFQSWVAAVAAGVAQAVAWFGTALPAAWTTLQGAWATLQPALAGIRDWLATNLPAAWATLQPKLVELQTWFQNTLPVATASLAGVWNDVLRPALDSVFSVLAPIAGALGQLALTAADGALRDLGPTLGAVATAVAVLAVPSLVTAAVALGAMALAAGPLLLLAGGLGLVAFTLLKFRDALPAVGAFLAREFLSGIQSVIQALKIAVGLIAVLANPSILKGTGLAIGDVARAAGQGTDIFTLLNNRNPAAAGRPAGLPPLPPPALGGTVDNSVLVDMSNATVNASDPEDVARLLDQMAARMAEEQAASAGVAVGAAMPEGA